MSQPRVHEEVLTTLRQIIRAIDLHSRQLVHDHGLTGPQLVVLKAIGRGTELSVGELAQAVSLSQGTVTGVLVRLERRGLILRTRSTSDRRRVLVDLTELGQAVLSRAPSLLQDRFLARFQALADWEQHLILSSLQRTAAMMGAADLEAEGVFLEEPLREADQEVTGFISLGAEAEGMPSASLRMVESEETDVVK